MLQRSLLLWLYCIYVFVLLFQHSDMNEEMRVEAMELCVTACEKFSNNNEVYVHCFERFTFTLKASNGVVSSQAILVSVKSLVESI